MAKHAEPKIHGRRRALDPATEPSNIAPLTESIPVVKAPGERRMSLQLERELAADAKASHKPRHRAAVVAAATGMLAVSAMSGTIVHAAIKTEKSEPPAKTGMQPAVEPDMVIAADEHALVLQTKVEVTTEPAPPEPPAPVEDAAPEPEPVVVIPDPPAAPPQSFVRDTSQFVLGGYAYESPSVPPPPAPAPPSSLGQRIVSAAYGQLGVWQDCTMLVTNSLAAVGINFHDWPAGYMTLGTVIDGSQAEPGDLLYYMDGGAGVPHIAVYAGNGMAIHGGWNGNQTVVYSAYVGSGPVFIRI